MLAALVKVEKERQENQERQDEQARRIAEEQKAQRDLEMQQWQSQLQSFNVQAAARTTATIAAVNDTKQAVNTAASDAAKRDAVLLAKQQEGFQMVSTQLDDISRQAVGSTQSILSAIELHGSGDSQVMQEKMDKLLAEMGEVQAGQELIRSGFNSIMTGIESMNAGLEIVRKTIVNNFNSSGVPIAFIIVPGDAPFSKPESSLDGIQDLTEQAEKAHGLFGKFKDMFNASSPKEMIQNAWDEWGSAATSKKMKLYLVDMYSWTPVGDGYDVTAPREMASKFLPVMAGVVKTMKVVNGVMGLGRLFGLPTAQIPDSLIDHASAAADALDVGSEYACVADAIEDGGGNKSITKFQEASHTLIQTAHAGSLRTDAPHGSCRCVYRKSSPSFWQRRMKTVVGNNC